MRALSFCAICVIAGLLQAAYGCATSDTAPRAAPKKQRSLLDLPAEMTVKQRSTTAVPGSEGALQLTIDDITGGQVIASLADENGRAVLGSTSLTGGASATFQWGDETYRLTLRELSNALVGEDFATFVISEGAATGPISEQEKIERLLAAVESAVGDVFIRNGIEYSAKDAARHLRTKWHAAGDEITTAKEFIDEIGTNSSITSEPYQVRLAEGREVAASDYLRDKLREIEAGAKPTESMR